MPATYARLLDGCRTAITFAHALSSGRSFRYGFQQMLGAFLILCTHKKSTCNTGWESHMGNNRELMEHAAAVPLRLKVPGQPLRCSTCNLAA